MPRRLVDEQPGFPVQHLLLHDLLSGPPVAGHFQARYSCLYESNLILFPYFELMLGRAIMLAKLTSKNQLTLPKAITATVEATDYFDVTTENGRIVLTPVRVNRADGVRAKLAELGLSEADISDAVAWARTGE